MRSSVARSHWIRAIDSISAFLAAEGIDERVVLATIRDAEAKAERNRARAADPGNAPAPTPEPAPTGGEAAS